MPAKRADQEDALNGDAKKVKPKETMSLLRQESSKLSKKGKADKLRVYVFPAGGGSPYFEDVEPKEGLFTLPGREATFVIQPGSVWVEGGLARTVVNDKNPQTINVHTLDGEDSMHPSILHGIVHNDFIRQDTDISHRQPWYRQATTWSIVGIGVVMILMMFWMNSSITNGAEMVAEALQAANPTGGGGSGAGGGSAASGGHNNIAPGG